MRQNSKSLTGFTISAVDGELGNVKDFYFDDESWTIRYLIVKTGSWLFGRKVLISPQAIVNVDWKASTFISDLTQEQVKNSPDIDTAIPVSRQREMELYKYYPWRHYWPGGLWAGGIGVTGMMMPEQREISQELQKEPDVPGEQTQVDQHLRSTDEVTGYNIKAIDGQIGEIEDFIIDDNTWKIHFFIVDTGNWLPGKKVIISPQWIKELKWETSEVIIDATVNQVKSSPEYRGSEHMNEEYERMLTNYYGRFINKALK